MTEEELADYQGMQLIAIGYAALDLNAFWFVPNVIIQILFLLCGSVFIGVILSSSKAILLDKSPPDTERKTTSLSFWGFLTIQCGLLFIAGRMLQGPITTFYIIAASLLGAVIVGNTLTLFESKDRQSL